MIIRLEENKKVSEKDVTCLAHDHMCIPLLTINMIAKGGTQRSECDSFIFYNFWYK